MSELIVDELRSAAAEHKEWAPLLPRLDDPEQGLHLAVLNNPYLGFLLDGTKTTESRFSLYRVAPFGQVAVGDLIFLKRGPVVGVFTAATVDYRQIHLRSDLDAIKQQYGDSICGPEQFWAGQLGKKFATLIGVSQVLALPPAHVTKKDMRGWVVLRSSDQPALY